MVLKGDALFLERAVNLPVALVAVVLGLDGGDGFHDFLEHLFILQTGVSSKSKKSGKVAFLSERCYFETAVGE